MYHTLPSVPQINHKYTSTCTSMFVQCSSNFRESLNQGTPVGDVSPEVSPEAFRYVELCSSLHEVTKDGLKLSEHFLVCVLTVSVIGGRHWRVIHVVQLK